jgi:hypothetical protein
MINLIRPARGRRGGPRVKPLQLAVARASPFYRERRMTTILILIVLILIALLWPAKYDPAILLKEWTEKDR